jgi:hypothetical protein
MLKVRKSMMYLVLYESVISVPVVRGKYKSRISEYRVLRIISGRRNKKEHDWKIKNKLKHRPCFKHMLLRR